MKAIDILVQEHVAIKDMLDVLTAAIHKMDRGETVNPDHLSSMVDFL